MNYLIIEKLLSTGKYERFMEGFNARKQDSILFIIQLLETYIKPHATWEINHDTGVFDLTFPNCNTIKKIFSDNRLVFLTDMKINSNDKNHIYIIPFGTTKERFEIGIKLMSRLM
jgi:hypothetical protein